MKNLLLGAVAALALMGSAHAATVDVSQNIPNNADVTYYTTSQVFNLPTGFTDALLNVSSFSADDSAVVELNGTPLFGTGIFGPGTGNFVFDTATGSQPYTFVYGNNESAFSYALTGAVAGSNTLSIIVNNNNNGINSSNPPSPLQGGPSSLAFNANVSFNAVSAAPEPGAWALMFAGVGIAGLALRRRRAEQNATFAV